MSPIGQPLTMAGTKKLLTSPSTLLDAAQLSTEVMADVAHTYGGAAEEQPFSPQQPPESLSVRCISEADLRPQTAPADTAALPGRLPSRETGDSRSRRRPKTADTTSNFELGLGGAGVMSAAHMCTF